MQVIRCEHPEGYRALYGLQAIEHPYGSGGASFLWYALPSPYDDGCYDISADEVCAAPPDRLDTWFPEWVRPLLRERGFRFVTLEVPEQALCHVGQYQVVIKRELCVERGEYLQ